MHLSPETDHLSSRHLLTRPWSGLALTSLLLSACSGARLPDCVVGATTPTTEQQSLWNSAPAATTLELAIDGSGSMLGLTGSPQALNAWKSLLKGVNLAAASQGLALRSIRVGS